MRWAIWVLVIGCKSGAKSEPPAKGSAPAPVVAADATPPDAPEPDAFVVQPVGDEEKARIKELFEELKAGKHPPAVDIGTFAEEYKDFFIDRQTAFIAKDPTKPGQRVIEIWPFLHAIGGGGYSQGEEYTQDTMLVMTFDDKGELVGLRY